MAAKKIFDCAIIGAGPAGLTAGIYLARFRRHFVIFDNYQSRASLISRSYNYPGAKKGISGKKILNNLREQLEKYEIKVKKRTVTKIKLTKKHEFIITVKNNTKYLAKNIIFATGILDIEPFLPNLKNAIKKGLIRHCAVCDAYEIIDKPIAILANNESAINEAIFLRNYTKDITLFYFDKHKLTAHDKSLLRKVDVHLAEEPIIKVVIVRKKLTTILTTTKKYHFVRIYSALGMIARSDIKCNFKLEQDKNGCLIVNKYQQTNIPGIYAAGDIVTGLSQICVATGHAAIAACAINKKLNNNDHNKK